MTAETIAAETAAKLAAKLAADPRETFMRDRRNRRACAAMLAAETAANPTAAASVASGENW